MKTHSSKGVGRAAVIISVALGGHALTAAPQAADPFLTGASNYNLGDLVPQAPPATGFTGAWQRAFDGAQSPTVISSGLAYNDGTNDLATAGGAVEYFGGGAGRAGRLLAAPYGDVTEGTVYFSFLMQLDGGAAGAYRAVEFHNGGFDDATNRKLQIATGEGEANPLGSERFTIRLFNNNSGGFAGDLGPPDTDVNLFVGKITFSTTAASDAIEVWRNPADLSSEATSGAPAFTMTGFDLQFDRVTFARFNDNNGFIGDEIRFGTTWADVLPIPGTGDSDGDGLTDTEEDQLGTDPFNPDTDGDFLRDGDEINVTSTDPLLADSDADGVNDATELSLGTDPNAGPAPTGGNTGLVGFDFFDYPDGGIDGQTGFEERVFDFDNLTSDDAFVGHTGAVAAWTTSFGTVVDCSRLATTNGSTAIRDFNGEFTGGGALGRFAVEPGVSHRKVYAKVTMTRRPGATWSGISFMNGNTEVAFAGVPAQLDGGGMRSFGVEIPNGGDSFANEVPQDGNTYCLVVRFDPDAGFLDFWVDPDLSGTEPEFGESDGEFPSPAVATGIRLASGGPGTVFWDDLVVTTTWEDLDAPTPTDSDSDTLRDSWEDVYAPADLTVLAPGVSDDADTLINSVEQALGTHPLVADTDGDGTNDDTEQVDGTNPCLADTDGDGLLDGVETNNGPNSFVDAGNTGTDPLVTDSDGDGESDGFEVSQGTDPTDPTSNSAALGLVIVDGVLDAAYGEPASVQTVQTQFGDNLSELNAAYAKVQDGKLYLMLTGNLEDNFNKLEIFIDSAGGGQNVIANSVTAGGTNPDIDGNAYTRLAGLTFDAGFSPDYHLYVRRGGSQFDLDIVRLGDAGASYINVFGGTQEGIGATGTSGINATPIIVGFDDSNEAGIAGGIQAADQTAAAAVTTGIELCIDLADLGNPSGTLAIAAMVASSDHGFFSNQVLGGLAPPQGNLGNPGGVNFETVVGDQSFTVGVPAGLNIADVQLVAGGTELQVTVEGLVVGQDYEIHETVSLTGFSPVPDSRFTAAATSEVRSIAVSPGTMPRRFFIIADAPPLE